MTRDRLLELIDPTRRYVVGDDHRGIRLERHYDTDVADLWDACTNPARLARWLGDLRGVPAEGASVEVVMIAPGPPAVVTITVHRCAPPRRLVASWLFPGEGETLLDLRLEPEGDGTALTFEHLAMPAEAARRYGVGWDAVVARLAAHVSGVSVPPRDDLEAVAAEPSREAQVAVCTRRWPRVDQPGGLIETEREIAAEPAAVWAAIADPDRLGVWFGTFAGDRSAWTITFDNGVASGVVTECVPRGRLVTSWRWDFEPADGPDSVLSVELVPTNSGTAVRLRHERVAGPVTGYGAGWFAHLEALAASLEGRRPPAADWRADWLIARAMLLA